MRQIKVDSPTIKLEQFLKWAEVTVTGGEAKVLIKSGTVKVNGATELQRGKQLKNGDIVEIENVGLFQVMV